MYLFIFVIVLTSIVPVYILALDKYQSLKWRVILIGLVTIGDTGLFVLVFPAVIYSIYVAALQGITVIDVRIWQPEIDADEFYSSSGPLLNILFQHLVLSPPSCFYLLTYLYIVLCWMCLLLWLFSRCSCHFLVLSHGQRWSVVSAMCYSSFSDSTLIFEDGANSFIAFPEYPLTGFGDTWKRYRPTGI